MFSISSIISAPFFGDLLRMLRTHGLSPRFLNIPNPRNIRYRFSDIGYPISTYKDSPSPPISSKNKHSFSTPRGGRFSRAAPFVKCPENILKSYRSHLLHSFDCPDRRRRCRRPPPRSRRRRASEADWRVSL